MAHPTVEDGGMVEAEAIRAEPRAPEAESRLVQGLRRGDAGAHTELYDRFAWRVHRFVTRRLNGDTQTAEEITVQSLVVAVRKTAAARPSRREKTPTESLGSG